MSKKNKRQKRKEAFNALHNQSKSKHEWRWLLKMKDGFLELDYSLSKREPKDCPDLEVWQFITTRVGCLLGPYKALLHKDDWELINERYGSWKQAQEVLIKKYKEREKQNEMARSSKT